MSMLPRVVWDEESKNGLRFEIGPSCYVVPTTVQCPSDGQSSCNLWLDFSALKNENLQPKTENTKNELDFCM